MREANFEQSFVEQLEKRGAWVVKLLPSVAGLPDRMVLLPYGRLIFVELKRQNGRVAPVQTAIHNKMRQLGFDVRVIRPNNAKPFYKECDELIRADSISDVLLSTPTPTHEEEMLP